MTIPAGYTDRRPPLVLHVLYRFDTGGLENGVVNLINRLPRDRFRHAVLAIDRVEPRFAARLERDDVALHALHKPPGHALALYPRIWRLMRRLRPAIVHSRNLAALEAQVPAWLARVPVRIHGEHGRDVEDLDGNDRRLQRVRRLYSGFVQRHVTVSQDLQRYLVDRVGIRAARVQSICNGVDTDRFHPATTQQPEPIAGCPFDPSRHWLVGTVGRMQVVKNQTLLVQAFLRALSLQPALRQQLRLVLVGDGPLRAQAQALLDAAGAADLAWLPGERRDVPELLRGLHLYALPSLAEGISNTVLEAMASGLPVLATAVGGNVELTQPGITGELVPSGDIEAMAQALLRLHGDAARTQAMRLQARTLALQRYSLDAMVSAYADLYDRQLGRAAAVAV
ncbi:MAG: TIGR03088 family PEP-CTERM/XrtA system glycosyltransferase [Rubrivivax sp.]|nr:TIGR03088 family PEP-CTERM/XrtA system glycosyltransferase [Rubrivivax sp.]